MDISGVEAEAEVRTNHMMPAGVMKSAKKEEAVEEEEIITVTGEA